MPSQFVTFRFETGYRYANVPYWTGRGEITPPGGNVAPVANNGVVGTGASYICTNGATSAVRILRRRETVSRLTMGRRRLGFLQRAIQHDRQHLDFLAAGFRKSQL